MTQPVVAEIVRSGFVEGHHYGSVVALAADGTVDWSVGAVDQPMLPRSCNKPLQALAMVRLGLDLPDDLLALVCASHSGEPFHIDAVRRTLAAVGLDETALQTPPDYPLDDDARVEAIRAGADVLERAVTTPAISGSIDSAYNAGVHARRRSSETRDSSHIANRPPAKRAACPATGPDTL